MGTSAAVTLVRGSQRARNATCSSALVQSDTCVRSCRVRRVCVVLSCFVVEDGAALGLALSANTPWRRRLARRQPCDAGVLERLAPLVEPGDGLHPRLLGPRSSGTPRWTRGQWRAASGRAPAPRLNGLRLGSRGWLRCGEFLETRKQLSLEQNRQADEATNACGDEPNGGRPEQPGRKPASCSTPDVICLPDNLGERATSGEACARSTPSLRGSEPNLERHFGLTREE